MFALALLLFTLPLMLLTALLIVLDSKGPVFYRQERVGLNGRPFLVIKFRSMRTDAEKDGAPQWAARRDCARNPSGGADPQASHRRAAAAA